MTFGVAVWGGATMARRRRGASLQHMDRSTRRVSLELHADEGPPAGVALGDDGSRREFSGWLGLICALDALLQPDRPPIQLHKTEEQDVDHPTHRP